MCKNDQVVERDPQVRKIKEYSRKVALLKPLIGVEEPEGKINKSVKDSDGD